MSCDKAFRIRDVHNDARRCNDAFSRGGENHHFSGFGVRKIHSLEIDFGAPTRVGDGWVLVWSFIE
jgi:hypothetical protein